MNKIKSILTSMLIPFFAFGCSPVISDGKRIVRGHISVGPAFVVITLKDNDVTYFADRGTEAITIGDWIAKQPIRSNPFKGDYAGCRSVYVEALVSENRMTLPMQGTYKVLRIEKILLIEKPHSDFFDSQRHLLPQPILGSNP